MSLNGVRGQNWILWALSSRRSFLSLTRVFSSVYAHVRVLALGRVLALVWLEPGNIVVGRFLHIWWLHLQIPNFHFSHLKSNGPLIIHINSKHQQLCSIHTLFIYITKANEGFTICSLYNYFFFLQSPSLINKEARPYIGSLHLSKSINEYLKDIF